MIFSRKTFPAIAFCIAIISSSVPCGGSDHDTVLQLAEKFKHCIATKNASCFIEHLPEAVYFVDDRYTKNEVIDLLQNTNSWLYENLFMGQDSALEYIQSSKCITIDIYQDGEFFHIYYRSPEMIGRIPPNCTLIYENGKLMFANFFYIQ